MVQLTLNVKHFANSAYAHKLQMYVSLLSASRTGAFHISGQAPSAHRNIQHYEDKQ